MWEDICICLLFEEGEALESWNITFRRLLHDWELERVVDFFNIMESFRSFKNLRIRFAGNLEVMESTLSNLHTTIILGKKHNLTSGHGSSSGRLRPLTKSCFSWLVAREACLTQENLRRRGFHLCSRCYMCDAARESNSHLFLHCPITGQLWQRIWSMPATSCDLLKCWNYNGGSVRQKKWRNLSQLVYMVDNSEGEEL